MSLSINQGHPDDCGREYRWIRDALQEAPDIDCTPMVVQEQYATRPRLQHVEDRYRGFPTTREELFRYDVVICTDISQGAFTKEQIAWTVELVGEREGGFVMVGGHTSFGAGGWDRIGWPRSANSDRTRLCTGATSHHTGPGSCPRDATVGPSLVVVGNSVALGC